MDEFEALLKRQPLRSVPTEWRREILAAADNAPAEPWWRPWFYPSPVAWAAIAATWLVIIGLNAAARVEPPQTAAHRQESVNGIHAALAERQRLLNELADPDPGKTVSRDVTQPGSARSAYPQFMGDLLC
jgi:hypothetical protein